MQSRTNQKLDINDDQSDSLQHLRTAELLSTVKKYQEFSGQGSFPTIHNIVSFDDCPSDEESVGIPSPSVLSPDIQLWLLGGEEDSIDDLIDDNLFSSSPEPEEEISFNTSTTIIEESSPIKDSRCPIVSPSSDDSLEPDEDGDIFFDASSDFVEALSYAVSSSMADHHGLSKQTSMPVEINLCSVPSPDSDLIPSDSNKSSNLSLLSRSSSIDLFHMLVVTPIKKVLIDRLDKSIEKDYSLEFQQLEQHFCTVVDKIMEDSVDYQPSLVEFLGNLPIAMGSSIEESDAGKKAVMMSSWLPLDPDVILGSEKADILDPGSKPKLRLSSESVYLDSLDSSSFHRGHRSTDSVHADLLDPGGMGRVDPGALSLDSTTADLLDPGGLCLASDLK